MTRLLIAGATGLVGQAVVMQALADKRVSRVIALTRQPIPSHAKLDNVLIDFSNIPNQAEWWTVDGVICALGTTRAQSPSQSDYRRVDYDYPLAIGRHARAHGATRFALTSSLGANPDSRFSYPRTKGELERDLAALDYPSLTIVRPSVLGGYRKVQRTGEHIAQMVMSAMAPLLPQHLHVSPASDVAATLIEAAIGSSPGIHIKYNRDMNRARCVRSTLVDQ